MHFLYNLFGIVLKWLYHLCHNYGLAIILLAVFAKIILIPLSYKQTRSMQIMRVMNPELAALQKKYQNNQQKLGEEMQKLYKKYNYNMLSGCLPMLIQMPILIGLFGALREPTKYVFIGEAMPSTQFLWIKDLEASPVSLFKDLGISSPAFWLSLIVPVISIVLTLWQQRQTMQQSGGQQNQQKGLMMVLNLMIVWISFVYSQGLALYWALQSALTILQNFIFEKIFPYKGPKPDERTVRAYERHKEIEEQKKRDEKNGVVHKKEPKPNLGINQHPKNGERKPLTNKKPNQHKTSNNRPKLSNKK